RENIHSSPWKGRINIFHADVRNFGPGKTYDLVISNPPFYKNDLRSPDRQKNISKHSEALTIDALFEITAKLLDENGHFAILLPFHRSRPAEQTASKNGLYLREKLFVKQSADHPVFRTMMIFQKGRMETAYNREISIKDNGDAYTKEFTGLLKDYYLYL
ncbi:MAG TPA: hypothetical protein VG847_09095, partial [Chitinophagaceae bacterium]|nr:hypothetical protein [Chitinophagaceae bacterium]